MKSDEKTENLNKDKAGFGRFPDTEQINPFDGANPFSRLFFIWILPLIRLGSKRTLTYNDLYPIRKCDVSRELGNQLENKWDEELKHAKSKGQEPKFWRAVRSVFWKNYTWISILETFNECSIIVITPLLLRWFMLSFGENGGTRKDQFIYAGAFCSATLVSTFLVQIVYYSKTLLNIRIRISISSLLYRKLLKLRSGQVTLGHLLNLIATDSYGFDNAVLQTPNLLIAPLHIILFSYILATQAGLPALSGIIFLIAVTPFQYFNGIYSVKFRMDASQRTDERARVMTEIINGIRIIKMYTWEGPFASIIAKLRRLEVKALRRLSYLIASYFAINQASIQPIILATVLAYSLTGDDISADRIFYVVAIFTTLLQSSLYFMPRAIMSVSQASVTLGRLEKYLLKPELSTTENVLDNGRSDTTITSPTINIRNLTAAWSEERITLRNLNLNISGAKLVIVIGPVGSGKVIEIGQKVSSPFSATIAMSSLVNFSSLLNVLLRELPFESGDLAVKGSVSYASQEAWIFSGTVRENILLGEEFDEAHYFKVVRACALMQDFVQFEFGDRTYVGDRGITLSGGQKARVNLARCLYRQRDIYLLDDPLSAVDVRVGKHLFEKCIKTYLGEKLCILVTHQIQYLPKADHIVVFNENGEIFAQGSYSEIQSLGLEILDVLKNQDKNEELEKSALLNLRRESDLGVMEELLKDEKQEEEELMAVGCVSWSTYKEYFKANGSVCYSAFLVIGFICLQSLLTGGYIWLGSWTNFEEGRKDSRDDERHFIYLWIYVGFILGTLVTVSLVSIGFFTYAMRISRRLHDQMFSSLVRAPTKFYDTNPSGRILNRVTSDLNQMDTKLPEIMYDVTTTLLRALGTVVTVLYVNYYAALPTMVSVVIFYFIRKYYVKTIRAVKRLESISRSPVYTYLSSSFQGISTIRTSKAQDFSQAQFEAALDRHTVTMFMNWSAIRWFAVWLEFTCVTYFAVITFGFLLLSSGTLPGNIGMAMVSIMDLSLYFQLGMRQSSEMENIMTSVERIQEYTGIAPEAPLRSEPPVERNWINSGKIQFDKVCLTYEEKPVLQNLSFTIHPKEKIGVVGRTGAGKSSLITALFRLTEPTGSILIDSKDITAMGLHDIREKISIIPQEPHLFLGTIRYNLDPFYKYTDPDIWRALEHVTLKGLVADLDMQVEDGGGNFSVGERQLICLARAILTNNKILVMDEATANVDSETDLLIQKTIREQFADCTVLTIAHRLHTVMDSHRILVLEEGHVKEFDSPWALLQNKDGALHSFVQQTDPATVRVLFELAKDAQHASSK